MLDALDILDEIRKKFPAKVGDGILSPLCDEYGCQDRLEDLLLELEKRLSRKD